MEKEQYRSVIRFSFLDGKTCEEIKTKLDAVYANSSPSMTTVRYWFNEFKRGREERPGRLADVVTEEIIEKVHDMILADHRTKVHEVADVVSVSYGTVFNILHNLGMKKLSAGAAIAHGRQQADAVINFKAWSNCCHISVLSGFSPL
ncbi:SETMR methyltransferase, partial [Acromyrmex heyeri]